MLTNTEVSVTSTYLKSRFPYIVAIGFALISFAASSFDKALSGYDISLQMIQTTESIHNLSYQMKKIERIDGEMIVQVSDVRMVRKPLKIYTKQLEPKEGLEVLYAEGENNGKAIINPNRFPWVNLKLDPLGKIMRKDQHHHLLHSGYDHFIDILNYMLDKYGEQAQTMMKNAGHVQWKGRDCWKISLENPDFGFKPYQVKSGENLIEIADKFKVSEFMIMERNDGIRDYVDVSEGEEIMIPTDYCKEMILYIDQDRNIPMYFEIHDDLGLYEQYEFSNVDVDIPLKKDELTLQFAHYGF